MLDGEIKNNPIQRIGRTTLNKNEILFSLLSSDFRVKEANKVGNPNVMQANGTRLKPKNFNTREKPSKAIKLEIPKKAPKTGPKIFIAEN
jgi:hypothetical protein